MGTAAILGTALASGLLLLLSRKPRPKKKNAQEDAASGK
jgi:hypothetical protein